MSMLPGSSTMPDSTAVAGSAQVLGKPQVPLLGLASCIPTPRCTDVSPLCSRGTPRGSNWPGGYASAQVRSTETVS